MPKQAATWLEPVLTQELCRVPAPAKLWDRVQLPVDRPMQPRRAVNMWFACASSAALLLVSAVGLHTYLKNESPRALRATEPLRFQAVVSAACHLCHEGDDLQASAARGVY